MFVQQQQSFTMSETPFCGWVEALFLKMFQRRTGSLKILFSFVFSAVFAQFSVQQNYNINRICYFVFFFIMLLDILELIIINYFHITLM